MGTRQNGNVLSMHGRDRIQEGGMMNNRRTTRRKADRSHDAGFVIFTLIALLATSVLFFSIGYERGASASYQIVKEATR